MGYEVRGRIIDKLTRKPLAGATVQVEARKVDTNEEGGYRIIEHLPIAGHMFMEVSKSGYETYTGTVLADENDRVTCDCELEPWPAQ